MRQRRDVGAGQDTQFQNQQQLLLVGQRERQTRERLREVHQAQSLLAELGTMFGNMSSLIAQQSEVIDKVEDDVILAEVNAYWRKSTSAKATRKSRPCRRSKRATGP